MLELTQLIAGLSPVPGTNVSILTEIIKGIYCISSGGVTGKNIARWTGKGGSSRSIHRFLSHPIDWLKLNIALFQMAYLNPGDPERYLLTFDDTVTPKSGKHTFGLNWFYSSILGQVIRAVSHHVVSLVDTRRESSFVLTQEQNLKPDDKPDKKKSNKGKHFNRSKKKAQGQQGKTTKTAKGKAGRPKGSKNKQNVKKPGLLYESFELLLSLVMPLLSGLGAGIRYVVGDGAYGNKTCCLIARQFGLELISKLNRNTALYLPYQGAYSGRGRPKKYGDKVDYRNIDLSYLVSTGIEDEIKTMIYQIQGVWTRHMPYLINAVIIIKIDMATQKQSRVVLFSTDLTLAAPKLIRFYALRFQIEFNFRDARQYFGLADFKNIKQQQVNNSVGLALFMDNVSLVLRQQAAKQWNEEKVSIQDLKAYFRAEKYLYDILNTLKMTPNPILIQRKFADVLKIGAINRTQQAKKAA